MLTKMLHDASPIYYKNTLTDFELAERHVQVPITKDIQTNFKLMYKIWRN